MHLQTHTVDGYAPLDHTSDHIIDYICFATHSFSAKVIIKEQSVRICFVCPLESVINIFGANNTLPDRLFWFAITIESFVHYVPQGYFAPIMCNNRCDVVMQNRQELGTGKRTCCEPDWQRPIPNKCMSMNLHMVTQGKVHQQVCLTKIE